MLFLHKRELDFRKFVFLLFFYFPRLQEVWRSEHPFRSPPRSSTEAAEAAEVVLLAGLRPFVVPPFRAWPSPFLAGLRALLAGLSALLDGLSALLDGLSALLEGLLEGLDWEGGVLGELSLKSLSP